MSCIYNLLCLAIQTISTCIEFLKQKEYNLDPIAGSNDYDSIFWGKQKVIISGITLIISFVWDSLRPVLPSPPSGSTIDLLTEA